MGRQFLNGHSKLDIVHNFRHLQIVWPMSSLFRHIGSSVEGTLMYILFGMNAELF